MEHDYKNDPEFQKEVLEFIMAVKEECEQDPHWLDGIEPILKKWRDKEDREQSIKPSLKKRKEKMQIQK